MTGEAAAGVDLSLLFGLVSYLIVMIVVGVAASRFMGGLDDYALGGRRLGPWVAAISERASGESAWFLLGLPGAAYALGFTEFWSVIGIAFGIFASWTLIALPLRRETERLSAITLPDYFAARFSDDSHVLRVLATAVILLFYTFYVAAQFVGAGKILNATFGIAPTWGIVIGASVVVLYTLLGGLLAVAWTDVIQGVLMAVVSLALPILALVHLGGLSGFIDSVASRPDFLTMSGGETGSAFVFGVVIGSLSWGFGYMGQPHLLTRYMAIRSTADVRKGVAIAMGWVLLAYWGAMFVGLTAVGVLGDGLEDKEQVMPLMATTLLPGWIAGFFIAGAIAAMMSTADSQLLVAASSLVEDVYAKLLRPKVLHRPERLLLLSRVATVLVATLAFVFALRSEKVIYEVVSYAWSGLGSSFGPPLLLALWWQRVTKWGAAAGMATGLVTTIAWVQLAAGDGAGKALTELLDVKFASFLFAAAATIVVSLLTPREGESRAG